MNAAIKKSWIGGLLAAFAASVCCIVPLLAIFGSISGAATYFNWIEPYRPYLIGITVLIFAFAWYLQLFISPYKKEDCCTSEKNSFWQSKRLLLTITLLSIMLMGFPYYSSLYYRVPKQTSFAHIQVSYKYVRLNIKGMGCADCTKHIDRALTSLNGVISSSTTFEKALTVVHYDPAKINADSIGNKIKEIGYQPTLIQNN